MTGQTYTEINEPQLQFPVVGAIVEICDLHVWAYSNHILKNISLPLHKNKINCIVGPSGGGKSTLLRSINRINDGQAGISHKGSIFFKGQNIHAKSTDITKLRTKIGMVFQKPCVFPKSIGENVMFGVRYARQLSGREKIKIMEDSLKSVSLWEEVCDRLNDKATDLSVGQQQRLCMARTLAMKPEVILFDEPTSALDPASTQAIEELMLSLKQNHAIVLVTHNIQQAKRIADRLIFIEQGRIVEQGQPDKLFFDPEKKRTGNYLNGECC